MPSLKGLVVVTCVKEICGHGAFGETEWSDCPKCNGTGVKVITKKQFKNGEY